MSRCGTKDEGARSWTDGRVRSSVPSATSSALARTCSVPAHTLEREGEEERARGKIAIPQLFSHLQI